MAHLMLDSSGWWHGCMDGKLITPVGSVDVGPTGSPASPSSTAGSTMPWLGSMVEELGGVEGLQVSSRRARGLRALLVTDSEEQRMRWGRNPSGRLMEHCW